MTYLGVAAASGQILFDTGDNALHQFGTFEGDIQGTIKQPVVSGIGGFPINGDPATGEHLRFNGTTWDYVPDVGGGHNLLGPVHSDANDHTVVRGDLIVGTGTVPAWGPLALGTAEFVLYSDGTDVTYTRLGPNTPFELGTVGAPSQTYTGDLDTGWSAAAADTLVGSASGVGLLTLDGTIGALNLNAAQVVKTRVLGVTGGMLNDDYLILASAGGITVSLPGGPSTGQVVVIKDRDGNATPAGGNRITIAGNGNTIDGNASILITQAYASFTLLYNGTEWNVI
jgi:hypothetical protein